MWRLAIVPLNAAWVRIRAGLSPACQEFLLPIFQHCTRLGRATPAACWLVVVGERFPCSESPTARTSHESVAEERHFARACAGLLRALTDRHRSLWPSSECARLVPLVPDNQSLTRARLLPAPHAPLASGTYPAAGMLCHPAECVLCTASHTDDNRAPITRLQRFTGHLALFGSAARSAPRRLPCVCRLRRNRPTGHAVAYRGTFHALPRVLLLITGLSQLSPPRLIVAAIRSAFHRAVLAHTPA